MIIIVGKFELLNKQRAIYYYNIMDTTFVCVYACVCVRAFVRVCVGVGV